jgi:hypothetical protein
MLKFEVEANNPGLETFCALPEWPKVGRVGVLSAELLLTGAWKEETPRGRALEPAAALNQF